MKQDVEELVVKIIREEMDLSENNIWISSQNRKIPELSQELYCIVRTVMYKPISSKSRWDSENNQEIQTLVTRADVQIDLLSRSNEARHRRGEVLMALNSYYSKNIQDQYCFRIFELPTAFLNTSDAQGSSEINRFTLVIPTMVWDEKIKTFDYYDKFSGVLLTEEGEIKINIEE